MKIALNQTAFTWMESKFYQNVSHFYTLHSNNYINSFVIWKPTCEMSFENTSFLLGMKHDRNANLLGNLSKVAVWMNQCVKEY